MGGRETLQSIPLAHALSRLERGRNETSNFDSNSYRHLSTSIKIAIIRRSSDSRLWELITLKATQLIGGGLTKPWPPRPSPLAGPIPLRLLRPSPTCPALS